MPKPIESSHSYVPGLDGLRTLAVALVILYHVQAPFVDGGLLGVGVFFTLSGYLITSNLMRAWDKRKSLGLKTFWFRRFRRLMPAALITIVAVVILSAVLRREFFAEDAREALSATVYLNNWYIIFQDKSYFDMFAGPSPLSHMWSLSVEEQFYVVWPLILLILLWVLRSRVVVSVATLLLTVASFVLMFSLAQPNMDNTRVYEGTDTRAGGLLLGAALAIWLSHHAFKNKSVQPSRATANIAGLVGIVGIIAMSLFVDQESMFLYRGGIALLSVATVLVILAVLQSRSIWSAVLGWAPLRSLGERSYGIYLWHMPLIVFLPKEWFDEHRLLGAVYVVVASVAIAALSWRLVEDPIRRHGIVEPFRAWRMQRSIDRYKPAGSESSAGTPAALAGSDSSAPALRFAGYGTALGAVILAAVLAGGAPAVIDGKALSGGAKAPDFGGNVVGDTSGGAGASGGAGSSDSAGSANTDEGADGNSSDSTAEGTAEATDESTSTAAAKPADVAQTACTTVVHVGDSTSIGMFNDEMVEDPKFTAVEGYKRVGVKRVVSDVYGGRSVLESMPETANNPFGPAAEDTIRENLDSGNIPKDACWVIAVGMNDAANEAAGANAGFEARVDAVMSQLKDRRVMWSTAITNDDASAAYANANMQKFNEALKQLLKSNPKARVYDWAGEVDKAWFLTRDFSHYGPEGNTERAKRFGAALAKAFPKDGEPSKDKVVGSGL